MSNLPDYEGTPVRKATMKITNAGADLTEALAIAPKAFHIDDEIYLVLKGTITKIEHRKERPDDDDLVRLHSLKAEEAVEVTKADVEGFLAQRREQAKAARDAAKGQERLPGVLPDGGNVVPLGKEAPQCETCQHPHAAHKGGGPCTAAACDCQQYA